MRKAVLCAFLLVAAAQAEGEEYVAETGAGAITLPGGVYSQAEIDAKLQQLNSEILNLREMTGLQLDVVSADAGEAKAYIDRILLVFLISTAVIAYLLVNGIRRHQSNQVLRMRRLIKDGETVLADIDKLMSRPDVEHYRATRKLAEVKSQLKESANRTLSQTHVRDVYAVASDPNLPALLFVQAKAIKAEQAGNWEDAVRHWEEVVTMDPNEPDHYLHLAHTYKNLSSTHTGADHEHYLQLSLRCYQEYANRTKGLHEAFRPPPLPLGQPAPSVQAPPPATGIEVHRPLHIAAQPAQPPAPPAPARPVAVAPAPVHRTPVTIPRPPVSVKPKPSRITGHRAEPPAERPAPAPAPVPVAPPPPAPVVAAPPAPPPEAAVPPAPVAPPPPAPAAAHADTRDAEPVPPPPPAPVAPPPPPPVVQAAPPPLPAKPVPGPRPEAPGMAGRASGFIDGVRGAAGRIGGGTERVLSLGWGKVKSAATAIGNIRKERDAIQVFSAGDDLGDSAAVVDAGISAEEIGQVERQVEREIAAAPRPAPPSRAPAAPPALSPVPPPRQQPLPVPAGVRTMAPEGPKRNPSAPTSALLKTKPAAHSPLAPDGATRLASQSRVHMDNLRKMRDQKASSSGNGREKAATPSPAEPEAPAAPAAQAVPKAPAAPTNGSGATPAPKAESPAPPSPPAAGDQPGRDADLRAAQELFKKSVELNGADIAQSRQKLAKALKIYEQHSEGADDPEFFRAWGLALTAKAVDSNGKRRAAAFEKAADTLKEGNLRRPHQNDFLLAALYALYGKERQCRRWLDESRDSGQLDVETLRTVPEFEKMRAKPWFGQYLEKGA